MATPAISDPSPVSSAGPQPPPIVVEYLFTAEESIRANAAVGRGRTLFFLAAYLFFGAAILWEGYTLSARGTSIVGIPPAFLGFGLLFLLAPVWRPFLLRYRIRRQHAKLATANKPVRWTITSDALHVKTAVSEARIEWSAILKAREVGRTHLSPVAWQKAGEAPRDARESRGGVVLWTHPRIGHWLPKSGFTGSAACERLRAFIVQRGIKFSQR